MNLLSNFLLEILLFNSYPIIETWTDRILKNNFKWKDLLYLNPIFSIKNIPNFKSLILIEILGHQTESIRIRLILKIILISTMTLIKLRISILHYHIWHQSPHSIDPWKYPVLMNLLNPMSLFLYKADKYRSGRLIFSEIKREIINDQNPKIVSISEKVLDHWVNK